MKPANTIMRFPNGLSKALTLSYDDGVVEDERLITLMKQYGIKGTFNINSGLYRPEDTPINPHYARLTQKDVINLYRDCDCVEVAVHGYTHPFLEKLSSPQATYEIIKDRECLEAQFGRIVRGMAYPYGTFNDETVEILRTCGIAYSRTVKSTEKFDIPTDWLRLNPTCHHNDEKLPQLTQKFLEKQHKPKDQPWLFYLWGHTFEFTHNNNWHVIENFFEAVNGKDDVWYATNIEIYNYVQAYNNLVFSVDMQRVHNPSAMTVWFTCHGKLISIAPGETVALD